MDWGWIFGTLVRTTGWTFAQCREQPSDQVFAYLEHLSRHPPEYILLAAVHGFKAPALSSDGPQLKPEELKEIAPYFGPTLPLPDGLRAMYEAAASKFGLN